MSLLPATVIDAEALAETALAALAAGTGVTLTFSLAILGTTRSSDLRAQGRRAAAALSLALGIAALVISVAAVALGLLAMIDSSPAPASGCDPPSLGRC